MYIPLNTSDKGIIEQLLRVSESKCTEDGMFNMRRNCSSILVDCVPLKANRLN